MDPDSDSKFYGDEETISALEARVNDFDVVTWWDDRDSTAVTNNSLLLLHRQQQQRPSQSPTATGRLHSRYQGLPGAWQVSSETIPEFLARLPPATTDWSPGLDWLWVANPHDAPPNNDNSNPQHKPTQLARFRQGGEERLALFSAFQDKVTTTKAKGKPSSLASRQTDVADARRETVDDLQELAVRCNVVAGKWMLFPEPGCVNEVWGKVARATAGDELGIAAKVETRVKSDKERLICVYTRDFKDKDDVARVFNRMRELELVRPGGKQIYYKSDAWTELGIYGGNSWGIGASTYSSNEIFGYIKTAASRRS
ncbi:DUF1917-domain-containing protein [Parathielavia hyrcaniae]|uniref:DUF1917-domain-containing protein n=1 Tax=Parathielavia hyrcaniae TaxID=113614 RepID=A0AAN6T0V4_9PEZI|nr:DUF1917-domain-containing protein [Parathielavia hyrcaniae]